MGAGVLSYGVDCFAEFDTHVGHARAQYREAGRTADGRAHVATGLVYFSMDAWEAAYSASVGPSFVISGNWCAKGVLWVESTGDPNVDIHGSISYSSSIIGYRRGTGEKECSYSHSSVLRSTQHCLAITDPIYGSKDNPLGYGEFQADETRIYATYDITSGNDTIRLFTILNP